MPIYNPSPNLKVDESAMPSIDIDEFEMKANEDDFEKASARLTNTNLKFILQKPGDLTKISEKPELDSIEVD